MKRLLLALALLLPAGALAQNATGVSASKTTEYGVVSPPAAVSSAKVTAYGVISTEARIEAAKASVYVVVQEKRKRRRHSFSN